MYWCESEVLDDYILNRGRSVHEKRSLNFSVVSDADKFSVFGLSDQIWPFEVGNHPTSCWEDDEILRWIVIWCLKKRAVNISWIPSIATCRRIGKLAPPRTDLQLCCGERLKSSFPVNFYYILEFCMTYFLQQQLCESVILIHHLKFIQYNARVCSLLSIIDSTILILILFQWTDSTQNT